MAGERVGEHHRAHQVAIVLDADDAVEVLRADEPVVRAIAVEVMDGGGQVGGEDHGVGAVARVMVPRPELLAGLAIEGDDQGTTTLVRPLPVEHPQDDPAPATRPETARRAAVEQPGAGLQIDPALELARSHRGSRRYGFPSVSVSVATISFSPSPSMSQIVGPDPAGSTWVWKCSNAFAIRTRADPPSGGTRRSLPVAVAHDDLPRPAQVRHERRWGQVRLGAGRLVAIDLGGTLSRHDGLAVQGHPLGLWVAIACLVSECLVSGDRLDADDLVFPRAGTR